MYTMIGCPAIPMTKTATIHPSAVIEDDVHLDEDVIIGPHCIISGPVRIKSGTRLMGQNWIEGKTEIGHGNVLYPGARLGGPPQDLGFDASNPEPGLVVGDENTFREGFTAHRGKTDEPTRIGNKNYFMTNTHVGHDSQLGDHITMATGACLGGHVIIEDRVIIGGNTAVGQFVRVGRGAFLTGGYATSQSVLPWFMMTSTGVCGAVNAVGMRRFNMTNEEIARRKWVYKVIHRMGLSIVQATRMLEEESSDPVVQEYLEFLRINDRPICHNALRPIRGGSRS